MTLALAYDPAPREDSAPEHVRVPALGSHQVAPACRLELLAAMRELRPRKGARLVVLDADVATLGRAQRLALRARLSFVPADGGLISTLNAWENITLPVGYHDPKRLARAPAQVQALLEQLGGTDPDLLAKLPEHMNLYERRLTAFVRAVLEAPQLLVAEELTKGLGPTKRKRVARFGEAYQAHCPGGTFIHLLEDDAAIGDDG